MGALQQNLAIPELYSPFPSGIHPRHRSVQERSTAWALRHRIGSDRLRSHLVRQDMGTFAARVLPDGNEEVVQVLGEFIIWLFGVDDGICEDGPLGHDPGALSASLSRLLRVAQDPDLPLLPGDPLAEGLRDLQRRLSAHVRPSQLARWIDGTREYFLSLIWEAHHRSHQSLPDLSDYALIRLYNGAATAVEPFLEMAGGYELSPAERHHPTVKALTEMCLFVIGWDNDILSFHKESRTPQYCMNAVRVVQATDGAPASQALSQVIAQRDRVIVNFLRLRDTHDGELTTTQRRYVQDLGTFIRAAQDWALTSQRYTTPSDPAPLPSAFTHHPTDDSSQPLPIATVQGWWRELTGHQHLADTARINERTDTAMTTNQAPSGKAVGEMYDEVTESLADILGGNLHLGYWAEPDDQSTVAEATNHLTDQVGARLQATAGHHVLDIGCGNGSPALHLARTLGLDITGVSISHGQIDTARTRAEKGAHTSRVAFDYADACALPYPDASFDAAMAIESMGHMTDQLQVLREVARVLRPGGHLVISDAYLRGPVPGPALPVVEGFKNLLQYQWLRHTEEYQDLLREAGLEPVEFTDIHPHVKRSFDVLAQGLRGNKDSWGAYLPAEQVEQLAEVLFQFGELPSVGYALLAARRP
ncbi:selina-4(15),7(11)-diene synthase [Kitasatospora sp. NPDC002040]|uniref:selina-4(15),7(11)-diene synthase n=1 Tax=Kitasatospora sp. NPDC002040 TaxID=3154661 RepID=UPI003323A6A6